MFPSSKYINKELELVSCLILIVFKEVFVNKALSLQGDELIHPILFKLFCFLLSNQFNCSWFFRSKQEWASGLVIRTCTLWVYGHGFDSHPVCYSVMLYSKAAGLNTGGWLCHVWGDISLKLNKHPNSHILGGNGVM